MIDRFDAFFFDLDGVIYLAGQPLPGAARVISELRARRKPVRFLTNDPRADRQGIVERLQRMGLDVVPDEVFNVGYVTALWLKHRLPHGSRVHVVGSEGLKREITRMGFQLSDPGDAEPPRVVVVGSDERLRFADIGPAVRFIRAGAAFVATNEDAVYPTPSGLLPGTGATVRAVAVAAATEPLVIGKPARPMFELARQSLPPGARVVMVGDNPLTDVAGAKAAGLVAVWLRRRPTNGRDDVVATELPPGVEPDYAIASLEELLTDVPPFPRAQADPQPDRLQVGVAALVRNADGGVLWLLRGADQHWALPFGPLAAGEDLERGVVRMVHGQTGLRVVAERMVGVYSDPKTQTMLGSRGERVQWITAVFACRVEGGDLRPTWPDALEARFLPGDARPQPVLLPCLSWLGALGRIQG